MMNHEERQAQTSSELALLACWNLSAQLIPCPFCDGEAMMTSGRSASRDSQTFYNPSCPSCGYVFDVGFFNGDDAVKAWNTRAGFTVEHAAKVVYQKYGANLAAFWRDAFAEEVRKHDRNDADPNSVGGNCIHCLPICRRCQFVNVEVHLREKQEIKNTVYDTALSVLCDPDLFDDPETANRLALSIAGKVMSK